MAEEALIGLIILEVLEDDKKRSAVRGKTRKWIKRRQEQGLYNNLFKELRCIHYQIYPKAKVFLPVSQ